MDKLTGQTSTTTMNTIPIYQQRPRYSFVIPGQEDLAREAAAKDFESIIDIGAGNFAAANLFSQSGKVCTATSNNEAHYLSGSGPDGVAVIRDFDVQTPQPDLAGKFDAVWLSHVLEHTLSPGLALSTVRDMLKPNGWLFVMVPPFKHEVVGGHVSVGWNIGILMYVLILCGFDVRNGSFILHGYNIAGFVQRGDLPTEKLIGDAGDIETLERYFPPEVGASQGFNGNIGSANWTWTIEPSFRPESAPPSRRRGVLQRLLRGRTSD